ncbi:helix-turn-helix domain-containing protein, partial [Streptomyces misionensis]|uniref:helix-turn-helix domain-containing protein n=2 Tax=Streptomyces TaxID=1883 RepID=UPI0036C54888
MNRKDLDPESSPEAAFGARIRSSRENRGWKQEELAKHMGYSGTHISAVETGRKMPTLRFSRSADQVFGTGETADTFERQYRELRHGSLLEGFPQYVGYEGRAAEIRLYEI